MSKIRLLTWCSLVVVLTAVGLGACGSSSEPGASTPSEGSSTPNEAFTGEPVTVAYIGEFDAPSFGSVYPEWPGAVEARAKAVNEAGGIRDASGKTHELAVFACNTNFDPNQATQCARDAVAKGAIAAVGNATTFGGLTVPVLEAAGVPSIGQGILSLSEGSSPIAFPINSSVPGQFTALPQQIAKEGAEKIAYVVSELGATTDSVVQFLDLGLSKTDATKTAEIRVPGDATDLGPYVAQAMADGTDGIVGFLVGAPEVTLLQQLRSSGYSGKIATMGGLVTSQLLSASGDAAEGLLISGLNAAYTNMEVEGVRMFVEDMQAYDPDLSYNDAAVLAWASTWVFERVASTLPTIDRPSMLAAMGQLEDFDMGGLYPPLTTARESGIPQLPRMYNPTVVFSTVRDGKIEQTDDEFFDPFTSTFLPG